MQVPDSKLVDVDRADFVEPVIFGVAAGTKRAQVGKEITSMRANLRDGVLFVTVRRGALEEQHIVPFTNVKALLPTDANRKRVEVPPAPVEEKPKPKPVVSDVVKL